MLGSVAASGGGGVSVRLVLLVAAAAVEEEEGVSCGPAYWKFEGREPSRVLLPKPTGREGSRGGIWEEA